MQTDPRRILSAVQDVSTTLGQWTMGSIQVGQDISQAQAQASESSSTSRTRSNQVFNQAFDLETQLGERLDQAEESLLKAKDQLKQTEEVANRANEPHQDLRGRNREMVGSARPSNPMGCAIANAAPRCRCAGSATQRRPAADQLPGVRCRRCAASMPGGSGDDQLFWIRKPAPECPNGRHEG